MDSRKDKSQQKESFLTLRFHSSQPIPPNEAGKRGLLFRYDLSAEDGRRQKHTILVWVDALLCMRWNLLFDRQGLKDTEKILARMAADEITAWMPATGPEQLPEEILFSFDQQPAICPYHPDGLPAPDRAGYEIVIPLPASNTSGESAHRPDTGHHRGDGPHRRKVFISYSHDNDPELLEWVATLAARLAAYNILVLLDQEDMKGGDNKYQFMDPAIREADRVLILLTPSYKVKAETRHGGVGYEYALITEDLYRNMLSNRKYIPVLISGSTEYSIPVFIRQFITIDMRGHERFEHGLEQLLEAIVDRPVGGSRSAGSVRPRAGEFRNPEPGPAAGRPPEQKETRDDTLYREFIEKLGLAGTIVGLIDHVAPHEQDPHTAHEHDPNHDVSHDPNHDGSHDPSHDPHPPHPLF